MGLGRLEPPLGHDARGEASGRAREAWILLLRHDDEDAERVLEVEPAELSGTARAR